jgi:hypothetical protein
MNKLPFLQPKGWPKLRKMSGTSKFGFSEDDELIEQALSELSQAIENKDHKQMMSALSALIECIMSREDDDGPDVLEAT